LLARYLRKSQSVKDKKVLRKRTILVIYSDLYFKKKIQPLVNAALEREPNSLSQPEHASRQLGHYHRIRAECWESESAEVREEVLKIYDGEHKGEEEEEEEEKEEDETGEDDEKTLLVCQQE
jgi:TATA-binding protein-associated factor Taf7